MVEFVPTFSPRPADADAVYLVLKDDYHLLMVPEREWRPLTAAEWQSLDLHPIAEHPIGSYKNQPAFAVRVEEESVITAPFQWEQLRFLLQRSAIDDTGFAIASCGLQVFHWDKAHQYCGRCGAATIDHGNERARVCENCAEHYYPRISPCVIGLITRGDECLLASHAKAKGKFFSALAGFIEPGETIESALHREVAEEVAIDIANLRYFGSQPWPFPGQLMVGFHADYAGGDIKVDGVEIAEAGWFRFDRLPPVPAGASLSGRLIQHFVDQCTQR